MGPGDLVPAPAARSTPAAQDLARGDRLAVVAAAEDGHGSLLDDQNHGELVIGMDRGPIDGLLGG
jgi:hypothetical protein